MVPLRSRERVVDYLAKSGVAHDVRDFDESTRSSSLAAVALGCSVAEIAKSVVFAGGGTAVVVVSGDKRVDRLKLQEVLGEPAKVATPEEVRDRTGYPIGGVPPFPHGSGVRVLPDASLTRFPRVWAAAGTPNAVFRIAPGDLIRLVGEGPYELSEQ